MYLRRSIPIIAIIGTKASKTGRNIPRRCCSENEHRLAHPHPQSHFGLPSEIHCGIPLLARRQVRCRIVRHRFRSSRGTCLVASLPVHGSPEKLVLRGLPANNPFRSHLNTSVCGKNRDATRIPGNSQCGLKSLQVTGFFKKVMRPRRPLVVGRSR
jgi:hypothetical protein